MEAAYRSYTKIGKSVSATAASPDGTLHKIRLLPMGDGPGYLVVVDADGTPLAPETARPLVFDFDLLVNALMLMKISAQPLYPACLSWCLALKSRGYCPVKTRSFKSALSGS